MTYALDFTLLPDVDRMSIFNLLDLSIEEEMRSIGILKETLNRARAAAFFLAASGPSSRATSFGGDGHWVNEALLRAGLAEFSSIDGTLARDLRSANDPREPLKIKDSRNPLIHLLELLRNTNIHSQISEFHRKGRRNRHLYKHQQLSDLVDWFNRQQSIFGAGHLLRLGVELYCLELLLLYQESGGGSRSTDS
jgi:hypothetical protein